MTAHSRNEDLMRTAFAAIESGDLDAAQDFLTEDFIAHLPGVAEPVHGREIWRRGVQSMLDGFPGLRIEIEDMLATEDLIAVRTRFRVTHTGTFNGVAATNREVEFPSLEMYRVADGRFAEEWVAPDMALLMDRITAPA